MRKLDIILDCDCVLAKTIERVLELANERYGLSLKVQDVRQWDLSVLAKEDIISLFDTPGFCRHLEVMEGAQAAVDELIRQGHNVYVATATPLSGIGDRADWFKEFFPQIKRRNVSYIECKELLQGDILLDDGLHNIATTKVSFPVIFDQPWNQEESPDYAQVKKRVHRVKTWAEFLRYVSIVSFFGREKMSV